MKTSRWLVAAREFLSAAPGRWLAVPLLVCLVAFANSAVADAASLQEAVGSLQESAMATSPESILQSPLFRRTPAQRTAGTEAETTLAEGTLAEAGVSLTPSSTEPYTVCPPGGKMIVDCNLIVEPKPVHEDGRAVSPYDGHLLEGSGEYYGWSAEDLEEAYGIPTTGGKGQTVAIVDAFGDETASADLAKYRETYGLLPCREHEDPEHPEDSCFRKVNVEGEEANYPPQVNGWALETSLDLDMVSAACPECHILLVEASGELPAETAAAEEEAANPEFGATEISNSFGYGEEDLEACPGGTGCSAYAEAYDHPGIPITVSSGDAGFDDRYYPAGYSGAPDFPATVPTVIAVGGTELERAENARGWSEHVWRLSGSGCSLNEPKPSWQSDPACGNRTDNDTAAVAEGVSLNFKGNWWNVGGTSVSAPLVAGIEAHAGSAVRNEGAEAFYRDEMTDVTEGFNGVCADAYFCGAEEGYDGPTGWGAPYGTIGTAAPFAAAANVAHTDGSSSIGVNGYVNAGGGSGSTYQFEYGRSSSYGTSVPVEAEEAGSGSLWHDVGATPSSNLPLGSYHYRLAAGLGASTASSQDHTFATMPWTNSEPVNANKLSDYLVGGSCTESGHCAAVGLTYQNAITAEPAFESSSGSPGSGKGQLEQPGQIVYEPGEYWVLDTGNDRIEKFNLYNGEYKGEFGEHGSGAGQLNGPKGLALLPTGYLLQHGGEGAEWIADTGNNRIEEFDPHGSFVLAIGKNVNRTQVEQGGGTAAKDMCTAASEDVCQAGEAAAAAGEFSSPEGIAVDSEDNVWVADTGNSRLEEFRQSGELVRVAGAPGSGEGELGSPAGLTIGLHGYPYVADREDGVEAFNRLGEFVQQIGAEGGAGELGEATSVAAGATGIVWVTDAAQDVVKEYTPAGEYVRQIGSSGSGEGQLSEPGGIAVNSSAGTPFEAAEIEFVVSDTGNGRIEKWNIPEFTAVAETLDGGEWESEPVPSPKNTSESDLGDISCLAADSCFAVGAYAISWRSPLKPLIEHWDGTSWKVQSTPAAPGYPELRSISCTSETDCVAVGTSWGTEYANEVEALVERWNGTEWSVESTPELTPPAGYSEKTEVMLADVSCNSSSSCMAVGAVRWRGVEETAEGEWPLEEHATLAEHWNGKSWTVEEAWDPSENATKYRIALFNQLSGVSCPSTSSCYAVGSYALYDEEGLTNEEEELEEVNFSRPSLVEHWNGSEWRVEESPMPSGIAESRLSDISCPSGGACVASGEFNGSGDIAEELRDGKWSLDESDKKSGGIETVSYGVSCTTSSSCLAIGWSEPGGATARAWAGEYSMPEAETENPSEVSSNTVTVHGTVDPQRVNTSYVVEYGLSTEYGEEFPEEPVEVGSGSEEVAVAQTLTGLRSAKTYHYRVVAESGPYRSYGADQTFTTPIPESLESTLESPPNPKNAEYTYLSDVSCTSASSCLAVGYTHDSGYGAESGEGIAEAWNGEKWSLLQEGESGTKPKSVSCGSPSLCWGVGGEGSLGEEPWTEAWSKGPEGWSRDWEAGWLANSFGSPPGGSRLSFKGISCTGEFECVVVGSYDKEGTGYVPLIGRLKGEGSAWEWDSAPAPSGTSAHLEDVSCASAGGCVAVGTRWNGSDWQQFAERYDGKAWSVESVPAANVGGKEAESSYLTSVSCSSATTCVAVGRASKNGYTTVWFAALYEEGEWSLMPSLEAQEIVLNGVSCDPGGACLAVGHHYSGETVAEEWNGSEWFPQVSPSPEGKHASLENVSCVESFACMAVGKAWTEEETAPLAEWYEGEATLESPPNPKNAEYTYLSDVSCTSASSCLAVGYTHDSGYGAESGEGIAEAWNGEKWSLLQEGESGTKPKSVSCGSPSLCWGVGGEGSLGEEPWTEAWSKGPEGWSRDWEAGWLANSFGSPPGGSRLSFKGISCTGEFECVVVGSYDKEGTGYVPLIGRLKGEGSAWEWDSAPAPSGTSAHLEDVSCASAGGCVAVGTRWNGSDWQQFAERYDGKAWSVESVPAANVGGKEAESSYLTSVSCSSATTCVAVGRASKNGYTTVWFAALYEEGEWSLMPSLEAQEIVLNGVSCDPGGACLAVGHHYSGETVAEEWNGSEWFPQVSPSPEGKHASLENVSCVESFACMAVGKAWTEEETAPLAVHYE